jgi:hypothetical protein
MFFQLPERECGCYPEKVKRRKRKGENKKMKYTLDEYAKDVISYTVAEMTRDALDSAGLDTSLLNEENDNMAQNIFSKLQDCPPKAGDDKYFFDALNKVHEDIETYYSNSIGSCLGHNTINQDTINDLTKRFKDWYRTCRNEGGKA